MVLNFLITRYFYSVLTILTIHEFIESFYKVSDFFLGVGLSFSRLYIINKFIGDIRYAVMIFSHPNMLTYCTRHIAEHNG